MSTFHLELKASRFLTMSLLQRMTGGRNTSGKITNYHIGTSPKRNFRILDDFHHCFEIPAIVLRFDYDPLQKTSIALLCYANGFLAYIRRPEKLMLADHVLTTCVNCIKEGNALWLKNIPVGTLIHNIELYPGKGGKLCRAPGSVGQLLRKTNASAIVRLRSGENSANASL